MARRPSPDSWLNSATGTRTRVAQVRAEYPNQLDYSGFCNHSHSLLPRQAVRHVAWPDKRGLTAPLARSVSQNCRSTTKSVRACCMRRPTSPQTTPKQPTHSPKTTPKQHRHNTRTRPKQPKWTHALTVSRNLHTHTTPRGLEPLRAEPNGFLVRHLNHSVTVSMPRILKL